MSNSESVLVVGSVAFDDLEMPHGSYPGVLGGAATYSSMASSLLAPTRIVGVVGTDFADGHIEMFRQRGIDTVGLEKAEGKTFRWRGRYNTDLSSRVTLDTQLNVFSTFRPKIPAPYKSSPFVLLGNIHPGLQIEVLDQVQKPKLVMADTMNFWISGEPKLLEAMLRRVDLLVINDEEARELSGIHNLRRAAREIRRRGPGSIIVKRGEHGAVLFDDHGVFFVPAYPLEDVVDPTGAGDTFAGGLVGYLARHPEISPHSLRRGMFYASALASFCVEDVGTQRLAKITKGDLGSRIEAFTSMVDYGGKLAILD